ncbi:DedA family protein [Kitasatospora sp. NPDC048538]|uniref:DedA family protein n=1 Tax=unclassified Kitasatospora TaxID=2633591 RepID=UPI0033FBCC72
MITATVLLPFLDPHTASPGPADALWAGPAHAVLADTGLAATAPAQPAGGVAGWVLSVVDSLGAAGTGVANLVDTVLPFVPSEIVLPVAGFAAGQGRLSLVAVIVWTTLGSVVGSWIVYAAGAVLGRERTRALAARIPLLHAHEIDRAEAWFERRGRITVLLARMVPVLRSVISVPAGIQRMPLAVFTALTAAGSLVWNTVFVVLGYWLGDNWRLVEEYGGWVSKAVVAVAVVAVARWFLVRARRRRGARHRA